MNDNRNIKDLELFGEPKAPKVEESFEKKEEKVSSDSDGHSFYTGNDGDNKIKKLWKGNKIFKHGLIWGTVAAIGLSVGLGVGLGVNWRGTRSFVDFPYAPSDDELNDWLDQRVDAIDIKVNRLSDSAVLYIADELSQEREWNQGEDEFKVFPNYQGMWLPSAERTADNEISSEKDDYKRNYGGNWSKEWTKKLITDGFDSEDEYKTSKIAGQIYTRIENVFSGSNVIDTTDINGIADFEYVSTISSNSGIYRGISNSYATNQIDLEPYYELYLQSEKPVAINNLDLEWSFVDSSGIYNGLDGVQIEFADAGDSFIRTFDILRAMHNGDSTTERYNGDWIEDEISKSTTGISRLGTNGFSGDSSVSNNLLGTLLNGGNDIYNTDSSEASDLGKTLHDAIFTSVDVNAEWDWKTDINDVTIEDFDRLTPEVIAQAGIYFYDNIEDELNKGPNANERAISRVINIGADDGKFADGAENYNNYLLSFTTSGASLTKVYGLEDEITPGFSGIDTDDLYEMANKDAGELGYTQHDLNKLANPNDPNNSEIPNFGIIGDFESWVSSNLRTLILNEALTSIDFIEDNELDTDVDGEPTLEEIVKNIYYNLDLDGYKNRSQTLFGYENYLEDNAEVYGLADGTGLDTLKISIENVFGYFKFEDDEDNYRPWSIRDILDNDGDLTGGAA